MKYYKSKNVNPLSIQLFKVLQEEKDQIQVQEIFCLRYDTHENAMTLAIYKPIWEKRENFEKYFQAITKAEAKVLHQNIKATCKSVIDDFL